MSEYPRVFDCLYDYCERRKPGCDLCDRVQAEQENGRQYNEHVRDYRAKDSRSFPEGARL